MQTRTFLQTGRFISISWQIILFAFEKTSQSQFSSHLSIFPPRLSVADTLPFMFLNLGQIYRLNESSSNSLKQIDTEILDHATIFSLDANHLCKPESIASICDFSEQLQQLEIVELMQTDYGRWIDLVARTSLSIRQPLLQFGTLKEQSLGMKMCCSIGLSFPLPPSKISPKISEC